MQSTEIEKHRGNFMPCWEIFSSTSKTESGATNEVETQDSGWRWSFFFVFVLDD